MPPRKFSRHTFTVGITDDEGRSLLTDRIPFRFQPFSDNELHTVREGDTLFNLAAKRYAEFDRPAGLWWVIADFQPTPIHDPTLALDVGTVLVIPSARTVEEQVLSENRRRDPVL